MEAQEYLRQILSLSNSFDAEALITTGNLPVGNVLESVNRLRRELKVLELLRPALSALSPDFKNFEAHLLVRLKRFLVYIFRAQEDPKAAALRKLDCTSIKICGLCLTQKALRDLKAEQLEVLIRRTEAASRHLLHIIAGNDAIDHAVRQCDVDGNEFDQFFNDHKKVRRLGKGSTQVAVQYSLSGQGCWCFTGASQQAIRTSFAMPTTSAVRDITTFLPVDKRFDGVMRMTMGFETELLRLLFGHQLPQPIPSEPFALERAVKSRIGTVFGSTVISGVMAAHAWTNDTQDDTSCVNSHVYPGTCIIVTLRVGWKECLQSVQILYR